MVAFGETEFCGRIMVGRINKTEEDGADHSVTPEPHVDLADVRGDVGVRAAEIGDDEVERFCVLAQPREWHRR